MFITLKTFMEGTLHNHPDRVFSLHFPPNNKYVFCLASILIKTLDLSLLNLYSSCLEIHCYETDPSQTVSNFLKVKSDTIALVLEFTCRKGQKYLSKVIESCFNKKKNHVKRVALLTTRTIIASTR